MVRLGYYLSAFDPEKAAHGSLVVMVDKNVNVTDYASTPFWTVVTHEENQQQDGEVIDDSNDEEITRAIEPLEDEGDDTTPWEKNNKFFGAGICRETGSSAFTLIVNSVRYTFNGSGNAISSSASDKKLVMGELYNEVMTTGNVGSTTSGISYTRSGDNITDVTEDYTSGTSIVIDNLTPRDQFAIQALRGMLAGIKDPSVLSNNEINFYCEAAYQWAANMMTAAANARAGIDDDTAPSTPTDVPVTTLENNTEKLLNNIVAAINDIDVEGGSVTVDMTDVVTQLTALVNLGTSRTVSGSMNIGNSGIGRDTDHPIYISGGGFPTKSALAAEFVAENTQHPNSVLTDFLTFNANGAVGYSVKAEVKKAILGWLDNYADIDALRAAILDNSAFTTIYNGIKGTIDNQIQAWLNALTVKDGDNRNCTVTVNTPT